MRTIVCLDLGKERIYLKSIFPVDWSYYISDARGYLSEEDAKIQLNSRYYKIAESLDGNQNLINHIKLLTYEGDTLISKNYYLSREE